MKFKISIKKQKSFKNSTMKSNNNNIKMRPKTIKLIQR